MDKIIIDTQTGEVTEAKFTEAELVEFKTFAEHNAKIEAVIAAELDRKAAARLAVLTKLGLTAEDLKALGL